MRRLSLAFLTCTLVMATGCDETETGEVTPEPAEQPTEATAENGDEADTEPSEDGEPSEPQAGAAGATVEDPTFVLSASATGPYQNGELGQFAITLTPRGEYHVNQEYPMSIELVGPAAVGFAKAELEREDAADFGEEQARFDVPFTPTAAGEHTVEAKVSFAVCTEENCIPDERTLALNLAVE